MAFLHDSFFAALELWLDTALFLLVGCALGGLVYAFFPGRWIEKRLGGRGLGTIVTAALVGTPLPLCSCGVLPTAVTLRRRGASTGSTVAFLVATPETGPDSLLVSFALLDPLFAIFRPVAAIVTAVVAGLFATLGERGQVLPVLPPARLCEICALPDEGEHHHTVGAKLKRAGSYALFDLLEDIGPWLVVGVLLAGMLTQVISADFVHAHLSSPLLQMLVAMAVGIPLYVCASASTPLAAAAIAAGFSPGAALVLMLTGPATNAASLVVLKRELGGRVVALMVAGIAVASLLLGLLLDLLYSWTGLRVVVQAGPAGEHVAPAFRIAAAVLLAALVVASFVRKRMGRGREQDCATCRMAELTGAPRPSGPHAHDHSHSHDHAHSHSDPS